MPHPPINRTLPTGLHHFTDLISEARESPALNRVYRSKEERERLLPKALVRIVPEEGYAWIDETVPCIVLTESYYRGGALRDLYLDLFHELTHLRQIDEGRDVWDERFAYVDRETEIEGYAVAVEEGRRLGMTDSEVVHHLSNPWMTDADVSRLVEHIERFLA